MRTPYSKKNRGFTMPELLVAVTILGITVSSLLAFFVNIMILNEGNRNLAIALSHAQHAMEDVKNSDFATIVSKTWNQTDITNQGLAPLTNERVVFNVSGDPKTVVVTVNWMERANRSRSTSLTTLVTEP
jgi:prepilin-type N-terminal cleavage/methylation domain-containing protein